MVAQLFRLVLLLLAGPDSGYTTREPALRLSERNLTVNRNPIFLAVTIATQKHQYRKLEMDGCDCCAICCGGACESRHGQLECPCNMQAVWNTLCRLTRVSNSSVSGESPLPNGAIVIMLVTIKNQLISFDFDNSLKNRGFVEAALRVEPSSSQDIIRESVALTRRPNRH